VPLIPLLCDHSVCYNTITGDTADRLATVVLEHAAMTDFCGIPLASLRENSITELNLERKGVGVPGAIVLSKLLPSAAALTSLNLQDNHLGPKGGAALADGLKGNSTLKELNLGYNKIGVESASALAAVLTETMITNLNLASNNLAGETGYIKTSEVQGSSFEVGAKVTYEGREMMVSMAPDSDGEMKMYDFSGVMALAACLPECRSLTSLNLAYTGLSDQANKQAVKDAAGSSASIITF